MSVFIFVACCKTVLKIKSCKSLLYHIFYSNVTRWCDLNTNWSQNQSPFWFTYLLCSSINIVLIWLCGQGDLSSMATLQSCFSFPICICSECSVTKSSLNKSFQPQWPSLSLLLFFFSCSNLFVYILFWQTLTLLLCCFIFLIFCLYQSFPPGLPFH